MDEDNANSANDIITEDMGTSEEPTKESESILAAIREMGEILFKKYPEKTTNIGDENANGLIAIEVLNDWMEKTYGYQYSSLKTLAESKRKNVMSIKGYGIDKFIEETGSIQAQFQQIDAAQNLASRLSQQVRR